MSTLAEKREKITNLVIDTYNQLDPTKTNSKHFVLKTKDLTDAQFIAYFTSLVNDPHKHLYFEIEAFAPGREPTYEMIEKAAYDVVGDQYCHMYDYVALPHVSSDPEHPYVTTEKWFNGYINIRRVQQIVNHKNHIPTSTEKRDPKTGQVAQESKASRVSDAEHFGMISQGVNNITREMFGPRGGDPVMRAEMERQIAVEGATQLSNMTDNKLNKTSLNTANTFYLAAGYETDLVTKGGLLPRTIKGKYEGVRTVQRKEGINDE